MFPAASTASALPPTWAVEKTIAVPAGFTSVRYGDSLVPTVVPLTIAAPDAFTATACAKLFVAPPRNIEYTSSPVALSFSTQHPRPRRPAEEHRIHQLARRIELRHI